MLFLPRMLKYGRWYAIGGTPTLKTTIKMYSNRSRLRSDLQRSRQWVLSHSSAASNLVPAVLSDPVRLEALVPTPASIVDPRSTRVTSARTRESSAHTAVALISPPSVRKDQVAHSATRSVLPPSAPSAVLFGSRSRPALRTPLMLALLLYCCRASYYRCFSGAR